MLGINVYKTDSAAIAAEVKTLGQAVLDRLDPTLRLTDKDVEVLDGFLGEGYGKPTAAMVQALRRLASQEGLLFDPVYSGKALAGLLACWKRIDSPMTWSSSTPAALQPCPFTPASSWAPRGSPLPSPGVCSRSTILGRINR